jgi:RNA polymerase subunit RPABC4/transcription elongation factor Spt4
MPPEVDLNSLGNLFLYLTAFLGAFLAALWLSLIFWAYRDARKRTDDRLAHVLASLVVALLGPPGLVIYLILRPSHTLEDVYQRALEEEALLGEIARREHCPGCGAEVEPDWTLCPHCHTRLRKSCQKCGMLMDLGWQVCPYCASPVERATNNPSDRPRPISG